MKRESIEERAIKSAPVYKLSECLALGGWEYSEITSEEIEEITDYFKRYICFFKDEQLKLIDDLIEAQKNNNAFVIEGDEFDFQHLYHEDFVFVFSSENKLYLIIPDELKNIYEETIKEENFHAELAYNREMAKYAIALVNLYGICEIEQFVAVWNQHHKEKTDRKETERFLDESCEFIEDYYLDDGLLISDCFINDDDIDDLFDEVKNLPYYMPTKRVISLYGDEDCLENLPEAKKMSEFLNEYVPNDNIWADTLRLSIIFDCKRLEKPIDIVNTLHDYNFPVTDKEAMDKFEKAYKILFENTHMWPLRGFTPYQYEQATGKKVKPFKIPEFKLVTKNNKKQPKKR